jgi:hydroxymethylbilane synthase
MSIDTWYICDPSDLKLELLLSTFRCFVSLQSLVAQMSDSIRISLLSHDKSPSNVLPILSRNPSLQAAIRAIDIETRSESVIRVGTRASALALVQANLVLDALQELAATETCPAINPDVSNTSSDFPEQSASPPLAHPWANSKNGNGLPNGHPPVPKLQFKLAPMSVAGDRNKIEPLYLMGAKALWTKDLEVALVDGVVDCIVHSLKDVPTSLPDGCEIAAVMPREDPRDALVVKAGKPWKTLQEMPEGSCIGSSSVRRVAQMRRYHPHLVFKDVRGNM